MTDSSHAAAADASVAAAADTSRVDRRCGLCGARIRATARSDARFCSTRCRQSSHRAAVRRLELEATAHPLRLAFADPPYPGKARRYYGGHPDFAGEVDHDELLSRLAMYDGWALATSSDAVAAIAARCVAQGLGARIAVWVRHPAPHPFARVITAWEAVLYVPARRVVAGDTRRLTDVLTAAPGARPRPTWPSAVIGMKPPAYLEWVFGLLGALPGDDLDDLYPGSGIVSRAWRQYTSADVAHDASRPGRADASVGARADG